MYSPHEYKNACKEIKRLGMISYEILKECETEEIKIWRKYQDLKRALEDKENEETNVVKRKKTSYENKINTEKEPFNKIIKDTEEIYELIHIHLHLENPTEKVLTENYRPRYGSEKIEIEPLDLIMNTDRIRIGVYIIPNNKPVNCFTLKLKIRNIYDFIWRDLKIDEEITFARTEEDLKQWYEKHKKNLKWSRDCLPNVLKRLNELEEKYIEAVELYKKKEWKLAYLEYRKYYYENHYSQGTSTEMYKAVLEQIRILQTEDKQLPLLLGEVTTEKGLHELSNRLKRN